MSILQVTLTDQNSEKLNRLSVQTGKTANELANEAIEKLETTENADEAAKFRSWRDAAERLAGIWKDRNDLPDFTKLRQSWNRGYGPKE